MKKTICVLLAVLLIGLCCGCGSTGEEATDKDQQKTEAAESSSGSQAVGEKDTESQKNGAQQDKEQAENTENEGDEIVDPEAKELTLKIAGEKVSVEWKKNESVDTLKKLAFGKPMVIKMSMYEDFEQVGDIGRSIPSDDKNTTTKPGDIVLYTGSSIVIFYGSNTWDYTRLGKITGRTKEQLADMLGKGDVEISLSME